jgi:hypothetical protein
MLWVTIQEPWIQELYLGFILTDPTKKPQHSDYFIQNLTFCIENITIKYVSNHENLLRFAF